MNATQTQTTKRGNPASATLEASMANLLNAYTNRTTGRTTVMNGTTLCGYVEKVADENRACGFYYAVSVAKSGEIVPSWCKSDKFADNVQHVHSEWRAN